MLLFIPTHTTVPRHTEAYMPATLTWRKAFCIKREAHKYTRFFNISFISVVTLQCQLMTHRYDAAVVGCCTHCAAKLFGGMIGFLLIGLAAKSKRCRVAQ